MNELVEVNNEQVVTTSLVVAESFGKRHDHVLRDIRNLEKDVPNFGEMFSETETPDSYGRSRKTYYINRDGFTLLAMGFTGKQALQFKLKYIAAFNAMEEELRQPEISTKDLLIRASLEHEHRIEVLEDKMEKSIEGAPIDFTQQKRLEDARKKRVMEVLGGRYSNAYDKLAKQVFSACARDVKIMFGIPRYNELPKNRFDEAMKFVEVWYLDAVLASTIDAHNRQMQYSMG